MKLMTESIYIGHDMKRFNEIRDALDLAKIPYKHKVRNQDSEWLFQGKGTKRSQFGSIGVDQDKAYEYEILVRKEDKARAEHEIRDQFIKDLLKKILKDERVVEVL